MPEGTEAKQTISVLVYGRNDSHGYNLPRRAATSLNAMALVLDDRDEILFVDANGPDTFPTFLESISDTLTERARAMVRIIRVRPSEYRRWTPQAKLPVHEPFCRNVGLRRVQDGTRWILSMNTDIIPVFHGSTDFASLRARLVPGHLHVAPRVELPEAFWEILDRRDPHAVIESCRDWGRSARLDVVVDTGEISLHDGPGDFQLFPLELGLKLQGFDESIVGGWHVDGNFCARSRLETGGNVSLAESLFAYHLDHNRMATHIHRNRHASETPEMLMHGVRQAMADHQRDTWGAPGAEFEEFRIPQPGSFRFGAPTASASDAPLRQRLHDDAFNHGLGTDSDTVFPHLASHLSTFGKETRLAYLGASRRMAELLDGFAATRGMILRCANEDRREDASAFVADATKADVLIVDAWSADLWADGLPRDPRLEAGALGVRCRWIDDLLARIHRRIFPRAGKGPLVLFVSAQHTWLDLDVHRFFDITLAPWGARVRPARARPPESPLMGFLRRKWARRRR